MTVPVSDEDLIFETAAGWWQRLRGEEPYDIDAFEAWLAEDEQHAEALQMVKAAWQGFDEHSTEPEILALRSEVLGRVHRAGGRRWAQKIDRRTLFAGTGMVAAAALAVPLSVSWWMKRPREVTTGIGEQRSLTLADGSRVTVDANTALKISLDRNLRRIDLLSGRAHFEVAKDASRPFKVYAADHSVTAIGTAFSVEWRERQMSVTLFEGHIALKTEGLGATIRPPLEVTQPFEQVTLRDGEATAPQLAQVDGTRALAWREGKLFFDDAPLSEAAARMNDYSPVKIRVTGPAANLRINGMFLAGQTDAFVEALQTYYHVTADYDDASVTLKTRT